MYNKKTKEKQGKKENKKADCGTYKNLINESTGKIKIYNLKNSLSLNIKQTHISLNPQTELTPKHPLVENRFQHTQTRNY